MTAATAEIQQYNRFSGRPSQQVSQATAIEQQRAIAEVQAQVVVAQSCPRDMAAAEAEMEYVCGRLDMAEHAFYQVTNRGTGPSIHLARELARIWGNIKYGVKELHRSDEKGESEILAFSWDIQKNTQSDRSFIVPHQRMKQGSRVDLIDLQDIYLNNQNVGARAVRETIFTILPRWFTEKAQNLCRQTLEHGEGKPLADRIAAIIKAFKDNVGVTEQQLEQRLGKKRGQWDAGDIAQLTIIGQSIKRGEINVADEFAPLQTSTADEIASAPAEEKPKRTRKTNAQKARQDLEEKVVESAKAADAAEQATEVTQEQKAQAGAGDTDKADTEVENTTAGSSSSEPDHDDPPGPDGGNDQSEDAEPSSGATLPPDSGDQDEPTAEGPEKSKLRKPLETRLFKLIGQIEPTPSRDDRLDIYRSVVGRQDINSTNDLSDFEVTNIGQKLYEWREAGSLNNKVHQILMTADAAAAENEAGEQQS